MLAIRRLSAGGGTRPWASGFHPRVLCAEPSLDKRLGAVIPELGSFHLYVAGVRSKTRRHLRTRNSR